MRLKNLKDASPIEKIAIIAPMLWESRKAVQFIKTKRESRKAAKACAITFHRQVDENTILKVINWAHKHSDEPFASVEAKPYTHLNKDGNFWIYEMRYFVKKGDFDFVMDGYTYTGSFGSGKKKKDSAIEPEDQSAKVLADLRTLLSEDEGARNFQIIAKNQKELAHMQKLLSDLYNSWNTGPSSTPYGERQNFFMYTGSSWKSQNNPLRPLSSVALAEGDMESIVADLAKFKTTRNRYIERGLPWRRGYLLSGPPGTGKSSIVQAIAGHFEMNLYYITLNDMRRDADFFSSILDLPKNSILLLEDIDVFASAQDRSASSASTSDKASERVSLSALLNVLDGPLTPDGLITFMTTNHREKLDPALIRKGRTDFELKIELPNADQIKRLFENVFFPGEVLGLENIPEGKTTAFYYDIFKTNMEDPQAAREALMIESLENELEQVR